MKRSLAPFAPICISFTCVCGILTGCTLQTTPTSTAIPSLTGNVHGGNQPVVGATIQLYAPGTANYGLSAKALISKSITTDSKGNFNITGDFTCPTVSGRDTQVYITATGGNPGLHGDPDNSALALMATLGSCSSLNSATSITINELTTVAAVWSLAQFMSGYTTVGVTPTNYSGLQNAFFTSSQLVSNYTGYTIPSTTNTTIPTAELDTLADILADCVNSSGDTSTPTTPCSKLFTATKPPGGTAATDTIGAALNIALNPTSNVGNIFTLASANAPFLPALGTAPPDWTVGILTYTSTYTKFPFGGTVDSDNNYWETGTYDGPHAAVSGPSPMYTDDDFFFFGAGAPAFGQDGALYMIDADNEVGYGGRTASTEFTSQTGGGITASSSDPVGLAIAPNGNLWMPLLNGAIAEFTPPKTPVSPPTGFTGLLAPVGDSSFAAAFDSSGFLYVLDSDTVIHKIDTNPTTPTVTTLSGGGLNLPLSPAIDHAGDLWVLNEPATNAGCCVTVSEFDPTGSPILSSPYSPGSFNANNLAIDGLGQIWLSAQTAGVAMFRPQSIPDAATILGAAFVTSGNFDPETRYLALDQSGNVWATVYGASANYYQYNPTLELVGVAGPVTTPLTIAVKNNTLGTRP